jgi:hypothetical protein
MNYKELLILLCLSLSSCLGMPPKSQHVSDTENTGDKKVFVLAENHHKNNSNADSLAIDYDTLTMFKNIDTKESANLSKFKQCLLSTIEIFRNKSIDTTILRIGAIDNVNLPDTIFSRVYLNENKIHIQSKWCRNDTVMWEEHITNPYMWLGEDPLFDTSERNLWIVLTIALHYSLPELENKQRFENLGNDFIFPDSKNDIKPSLIKYYYSSESEFLIHGAPEERNSLYYWYEPKRVFLLYYAP